MHRYLIHLSKLAVEEEVHDIVIVGGGICGLALSLGLHRKGIKSLVLERSEVLRSDGAALGLHGSGWHALDQLGVGTDLRNCSTPLTGLQYEYVSKDDKNVVNYSKELRCPRRKDVVETLARYVPAEQIRFGCQVTSLDFDHRDNLHVLATHDGSVIKAKVLIGCDGMYSVISKSLQLEPPNLFPIWITRGFMEYPEGHLFGNHILQFTTEKATFGRIPIDNKNIHFFVTHFELSAGDMDDPGVIKEHTIKVLKGAPNEILDVVRNCDMETLSIRQPGYRSPWSLYNQNFRKGTMTVAGDAMHVMGPFIGAGGSAALEDAIVLTRLLSNAINAQANFSSDKKWSGKVEEALDLYIKERRFRVLRLAMQSYLIGTLISTKSWIVKLAAIFMLIVFFGAHNHNYELFNCGTI